MSSGGSVTQWIGQLKAGDHDAVAKLWKSYFDQLVRLARRKLRGARKRVNDEEDVALSALATFCRRAEQGRFPDLHDRDSLWLLLVVITARKAIKVRAGENRQKRGGGAVRGESALIPPGDDPDAAAGFEQFFGREPPPDLVNQLTEEFARRLRMLPAPDLRSVAQWKFEGYSNAEIARKLDCVEKTVERKLRVIRSIWGKEDA
jgi:DNA-directed RNA polymerase specialized sigma24 family protein